MLAMPVRWLAANLSPHRHMLDPKSVYVGFVVDQMALCRLFFEYFSFILSISLH